MLREHFSSPESLDIEERESGSEGLSVMKADAFFPRTRSVQHENRTEQDREWEEMERS